MKKISTGRNLLANIIKSENIKYKKTDTNTSWVAVAYGKLKFQTIIITSQGKKDFLYFIKY